MKQNEKNNNKKNGDEISDEFLKMYVDFYIQNLFKNDWWINCQKILILFIITNIQKEGLSEGAAPFLKYDPVELNSKKIINKNVYMY